MLMQLVSVAVAVKSFAEQSLAMYEHWIGGALQAAPIGVQLQELQVGAVSGPVS